MNALKSPATIAMMSITMRKYIQDIAELNTSPFVPFSYTLLIYRITLLSDAVNASMILVNTIYTIIGLTIGSVIFQNVSQPDAPSIEQDS